MRLQVDTLPLESLDATTRFALFWLRVQTAVAACQAGVQAALRGPLLAGHYLLRAARKASTASVGARNRV